MGEAMVNMIILYLDTVYAQRTNGYPPAKHVMKALNCLASFRKLKTHSILQMAP